MLEKSAVPEWKPGMKATPVNGPVRSVYSERLVILPDQVVLVDEVLTDKLAKKKKDSTRKLVLAMVAPIRGVYPVKGFKEV